MYFEERLNEKKEDPFKDKITFTYPWFITFPDFTNAHEIFNTKYKFHSASWVLHLKPNNFSIENPLQDRDDASWVLHLERNNFSIENPLQDRDDEFRVWNGTCICSYNLYCDFEKRILLYSSPRIEMRNGQNPDDFTSPVGFMSKFDEALNEQAVAKLDVFIELQLPAKHFYRPFEMPSCELSRILLEKYPEDIDNGFESEFLNDSDFVFKCPDGEMPAMKIVLNNANEYMHEHFNAFPNSNELVVYHSIDVIKPIIICFHTRCFKMPKSFDLDYAKRLLIASDFFKPDIGYCIEPSIHQALCQKFVEEKHTFNSILEWLKIAYHQSFDELQEMVTIVISDKFYYEWHQTFPPNARNDNNPIFHDIFTSCPEQLGRPNRAILVFYDIDSNMRSSLKTVIVD